MRCCRDKCAVPGRFEDSVLERYKGDKIVSQKNTMNRREFVKTTAQFTAGALAFPYFVPSSALGKDGRAAPSNRITMGCIGVGGMGSGDMRGFLESGEVQVLAVCDVDSKHRERARATVNSRYGNADCDLYNDFREIIERDDIDSVSIGTPDHWHALVAIAAARAGKDIQCQKPLAYTIGEGRAMCDAVTRHGVVWLTGSQQRSYRNFRYACELVRNGRIGKVHTVEVGLPNTNSINNKGTDRAPVPEGFDYDMWLGPAPMEPYCASRCHWNFRWISDYSGGQITDWAGHHCDIAQWGMGTEYTSPVEIEGRGIFPKDSLFDTVENYWFDCKYDEGFTLKVAGAFTRGVKFIGTDGWVFVSRGKLDAHPKKLLKSEIGPNEIHLYESNNHRQNFIDCVRSRRETVAPIEVAHRSIMIGHLGVIAIKLGRKLRWDPKKERFINDAEADRMLYRPMRNPWHL